MTVTEHNPTYHWVLLWKDSQRASDGSFYGHSFYQDITSGRVAIKDMSGPLPHLTDDGVLWVDLSRPMSFTLEPVDGKRARKMGYASLPVLTRHGDEAFVPMLWADAVYAAKELRMKVVIDKEIGELCRLVTEVALLAVEKQ